MHAQSLPEVVCCAYCHAHEKQLQASHPLVRMSKYLWQARLRVSGGGRVLLEIWITALYLIQLDALPRRQILQPT